MTFQKVLFIQLKMLGDILMLTPTIKAFKQKYPQAELNVVVQRPGDELLKLNPYIDNIIVANSCQWYSLLRQLNILEAIRSNHYDMVVDFLGNPRTAHYTFLSGANIRVGYRDARFKYAYNRTYDRIHSYSAISKLQFLSFLDIDTGDYQPEFYLDDKITIPNEMTALGDKKLVAISPVSLRAEKIWPTGGFAEVAEYLSQKFNLYPVVIAGPGEQSFLDEYAKYAKTPYTPLLIENLKQLGAVLKRCNIFIGNDNGPKHIAVAVGLPTFTIYGHISDPICWNYPDPARHQFIGGANQPDCTLIKQIPTVSMIDKLRPFMENLYK